MISQSCGEDWIDTKISLSTAVPAVGGNVPELETQNVRIKPKYVAQRYIQNIIIITFFLLFFKLLLPFLRY
jgi:hypothetical protein